MGPPEADALLVVDMQCGLVTGPGANPGAADLLAAVGRLVRSARDSGVPIVHIQNDGPAGADDEPGSPGWALAVEPMTTEPVVRKREDDFADISLEVLLKEHQAACVVICGLQSEMCVAATARSAMQRGLVVVLPHDAHSTYPIANRGGGVAVSAAQIAHVAEWSLGDALVVPRSTRRSSSGRVSQTHASRARTEHCTRHAAPSATSRRRWGAPDGLTKPLSPQTPSLLSCAILGIAGASLRNFSSMPPPSSGNQLGAWSQRAVYAHSKSED